MRGPRDGGNDGGLHAVKRPGAWLASRWAELALLACVEATQWFALDSARVDAHLQALVLATTAFGWLAALGVGYARSRRLVRAAESVSRTDRPLDAVAALPELPGPEGRAFCGALEAVEASAREQVAGPARQARAQRDFIESWVHEIKTPIAAARLAIENSPGPGTARVADQLDRIGQHVDQALYVARSDSVDRDFFVRELEVRDVVAAAVRERRRSLFDAGFEVDLSAVASGARARGDEKWLVFMLGQLIDNAVKYRRRGGAVASGSEGVGSGATPPCVPEHGQGHAVVRPRIVFSFFREGEGARAVDVLRVADNGLGISPADLPRVFDRGFTGSRGRGGASAGSGSKATGIGLYLVRELAGKMGLAVRADSTEGAATRVELVFPAL